MPENRRHELIQGVKIATRNLRYNCTPLRNIAIVPIFFKTIDLWITSIARVAVVNACKKYSIVSLQAVWYVRLP